MKGKIRIAAIGIVILLTSYFIGQNVVLPLRNPKAEESSKQDMSEGIDWIEESDSLELYGYKETEDNPWSATVGKIDASGELPKGILITPSTGVGASVEVGEQFTLEIEASIHPWVAEYSDGAMLEIQYAEKGKNESRLLAEYEIKDSDSISMRIDLGEISHTQGTLKVICPVEKSGDSAGDWIFVTKLKLSNQLSGEERQGELLRSVHYFADEWPINFWSCELTNMDEDFAQIVSDGFNNIILVIPWKEFQPSMNPVSYNEDALAKLRTVMEKAKQYNLSVMVRVGYLWDYYEDSKEQCTERFYNVVGDDLVQEAWYDYCATIYGTLNEYSNFAGGFITWEDFWINTYLGGVLDEAGRRERAVSTGFQDWVKSQYSVKQLNKQYGLDINDYAEIAIPDRSESMMELWYTYIDEFLMQLLEESQKYFPDLSMEVRTDWDIYKDLSGEMVYYKHDKTYACASAAYTAVMYGIPQGCINQGERLHYNEAMEKTEYILETIAELNDNKPIYIDQFLFADNTPGFEQNAQIYEEEVEDYLKNMDGIMQKYTMGYGVWTYRDYAANLLYNSQFGKGLEGWIVDGGEIILEDNNQKILLHAGGTMEQDIPSLRLQFPGEKYIVSMDVTVQEETELKIAVGAEEKLVNVAESGSMVLEIEVDKPDGFGIRADKDIIIDNIKVYNHVQNGFLYDLNGNEQTALAGMRYLNEAVGNN